MVEAGVHQEEFKYMIFSCCTPLLLCLPAILAPEHAMTRLPNLHSLSILVVNPGFLQPTGPMATSMPTMPHLGA